MKQIQWFPGHMSKAMQMMEKNVKLCDGAILVLDARAVYACMNDKLVGIFHSKPILYVVNKSDLISESELKEIMQKLRGEGRRCISVVGTEQRTGKAVYNSVYDMLKPKIEQREQRGITKPLRFMVCGIPNTGKSTIINSVIGRHVAQTGDRAGVTKGKQWIKLDKLELLDTPGTMQPAIDDQKFALHLAYIGCIRDEILDLESIAVEFISEMEEAHEGLFAAKYGASGGTPLEIFDSICAKRGFLLRRGEPDYTRGARALLDDFRKGRLGAIALEK